MGAYASWTVAGECHAALIYSSYDVLLGLPGC